MTLQRFLNGMADSRWSWPFGLSRFKPAPTSRWTAGASLVSVLAALGGAAIGGLVLMGLFSATPMRGSWWPMAFALQIGLAIGGFTTVLVAAAWNRRAARLVSEGLELPPPPPPRRWWQTFLVAPFYVLVFYLATPVALWLAVDNVRGTRAWAQERERLIARGEPLTAEQVLGPRPPDEQNFAMTPLLRPVLDYHFVVTNGQTEIVWRDAVARRRPDAIGLPPQVWPEGYSPRKSTNDGHLSLDSYARGIRAQPLRKVEFDLPPDLALRYGVVRTNPAALGESEARALAIPDPAREVLDYLRRFDPEMSEIAEASRRPACQFPVHWDSEGFGALLPQLAHGKRFSQLFRVRAAARLRTGDAAGAHADTLVMLRLAERFGSDPLLISLLVRLAQNAIGVGGVWEGLVSRQWSEAQVAELQSMLLAMDLGPAGVRAVQGERAVANAFYDQFLASPSDYPLPSVMIGEGGDASPQAGAAGGPRLPRFLAPRGLFRRNQVNHNRFIDVLLARFRAPGWEAASTHALSDRAALGQAGLVPTTPYNIMAAMLAPAVVRVETRLARQQTLNRLAGVACALERHRSRAGSYPESLAALTPGILSPVPPDPMNGKPFGYRRLDNGWYLLWSVGLNGRDDGGTMKEKDNDATGDWVWPLPVPSVGPRLL